MATPPIRDCPAIIGMIHARRRRLLAANILLPWSHRAFSLMKRWALGTYHGLRRKHVDDFTSMNSSFATTPPSFHRHVSFETVPSASPRVANPKPTGTLSNATIRANRQFAPSYYI